MESVQEMKGNGDFYDFFLRFTQHVVVMTVESMYPMYGEEPVKRWLQGDKDADGHFICNGAVHQLLDMLYEDHYRFGVGDFGSIWFDTKLVGGSTKTKRTRVSLHYDSFEGRFVIMLDATFDRAW